MRVESPFTVNFKGKEYSGDYQIADGIVTVFHDGKSKSTQVGGSQPEMLARLLLLEMVGLG